MVTNGKISFAFFVFVTKSLCSVEELNFFSQDFMNKRRGIASVTESLFKVSFVSIKFSLIELVLKAVANEETLLRKHCCS